MLESATFVRNLLRTGKFENQWVAVLMADSVDLNDELYRIEANCKDSLLSAAADCLYSLTIADSIGRSIFIPRFGITLRFPDGSVEQPVNADVINEVLSIMVNCHNWRGFNIEFIEGALISRAKECVAAHRKFEQKRQKPQGFSSLHATVVRTATMQRLFRYRDAGNYVAGVVFSEENGFQEPVVMAADDEDRLHRMIVSAILEHTRVNLTTGEILGGTPIVVKSSKLSESSEQVPADNLLRLIQLLGPSLKTDPITSDEFLPPGFEPESLHEEE